MALGLFSLGNANDTAITPTRDIGDLNTVVTPDGNVYDITGGTRPNNGPNLFHSFNQFSIGNGDTANFKNDPAGLKTDNIFSRVKGGNISRIEGTITTTGFQDADVYLLNPAGFLFGPGANINVKGAFFTSTADFVEFENGARFSADASPIDAQLAVAPPEAFGFLSKTEAVIESQGIEIRSLRFSSEPTGLPQDFALIGGPIDISDEGISAGTRAININIVSVGREATGKETFTRIYNGKIVPEEGQPRHSVTVSTTGLDTVVLPELENIENKSGDIRILGDTIEITDSFLFTDQDSIKPGDIVISASDTIDINDSDLTTVSTQESSGSISLYAKHGITLRGENFGTSLLSDSFSGVAGKIGVNVKDGDLDISNTVFQTEVEEGAPGKIELIANNGVITLGEGTAILSRAVEDDAGEVNVSARVFEMRDGANIVGLTEGPGKGATVKIRSPSIVLTDGSKISTESTGIGLNVKQDPEIGRAGDVILDAQGGIINIFGEDTLISSETSGEGKAGSVSLIDGDVTISDGASVTARTTEQGEGGSVTIINAPTVTLTGGGKITTESTGEYLDAQNISIAGDAGTIKIRAGRFVVQDGGEVSATTSTAGQGGSIDIQATDVKLRDKGSISAKSTGTGNSGTIDIKNADTVRLQDESTITVTTDQTSANAGNININAESLVHLRNQSAIETSAAVKDNEGTGQGGDITIDPKIVVLDGASAIRANAKEGEAGNIRITITDGGALFKSPDSVIEASAGPAGIDGTVEISRTDSDIIKSTLVLPESFLDVTTLLGERCTTRSAAGASSFVVSGRSGVPPGPDALLPDYFSNLDKEPAVGQDDEATGALPVANRGNADGRLSQLIIECGPR